MHEAKFGAILNNACRLAGRDPSLLDVPAGWKVLAALALNAGIDALAAEKFPQMQRVEFRRYRPEWDALASYSRYHEVWHGEAYWRLDDTTADGEPGVADGWRKLNPNEVARFIAFEQPWEPVVMQSFGVDTARFAYVADPKYNPEAAPLRGCRLSELGVMLPADAPAEGVYVKFVPELPQIEFCDWTWNRAYSAGDAVYRPTTLDVWQCREDVEAAPSEETATPPEDAGDGTWKPLRIRSEFANYLTRLVAADLMTEDQGKFQTKAAADAEFDKLVERYHEGNGETRIRTGRFA
jgi:hypothetical protein